MATWNLVLELDPESEVPIYMQLTRRLIEAIAHGRLAPGRRLPGSRSLARAVGVHRNTVSAAYDELLAEGWLTSRPRSGTFVCDTLPASWATAREPRTEGGARLGSVKGPLRGLSSTREARALPRVGEVVYHMPPPPSA